jgi:pyruvate,water dikinase
VTTEETIMTGATQRTFPSPFSVSTPAGADGWEEMYPYYTRFREDERESEDERFWFFDGMHNPTPIYPFDAIMVENWWVSCNLQTTRLWQVPPALGIDQRILNGYIYCSPTAITDPDVIAARVETFARRAGYYFEHWDEIYAAWIEKAEDCIARLRTIEFAPLPEKEPESSVTEHPGVYSSWHLLRAYDALIENMFEMGSYHFEMLNLGYGAYNTFREFCEAAFPGITDQTIARMVAGIDIIVFRPDDELRKLARIGVERGLGKLLRTETDPDALLAAVADRPGGDVWLNAWDAAKEPWFWYSTGVGYTHTDRAWMDDLTLPLTALRGYVEQIEAGEDIERPLERILDERARITEEYADALGDEDDRRAFLELTALARKVYPYVENHNFYVEHWHHSIFWNKVRDLGDVFVAAGFFADREDIFYLQRHEVHAALYDLCAGWATGCPARGPSYWPPIVARRAEMLAALRTQPPEPALGRPPEQFTEPISVMLWGITEKMVDDWLGGDGEDEGAFKGVAASPGVARGPARIVSSADELARVEAGDVLVCRITAPSWAPVFSRIAAAVSDIGGIMAHTAIVSREYGLPAVVGTGFASRRIEEGQIVEVDGNRGLVTVVDAT